MENFFQPTDTERLCQSISSDSLGSLPNKASTGVSQDNGVANSARPLPIARNQSVAPISGALSRAEIGCSANDYAPQYAPPGTEIEQLRLEHPPKLVNRCLDELRPDPSYVRHGLSPSPKQLSALAAIGELAFAPPAVAPSNPGDETAARTVMRSREALKPHPSLLKHDLMPTNERLLALEKLGEALFEQPLLITKENLIVDGYARWLIARRQQRAMLLCFECQLTEQEALQRILQTHRRPEWLNAFSRVQVALDLEPWYRARALANQSAGGKGKGSSKLTEDRRLDCRKQIATITGVSTGNVAKVKQIIRSVGALQLIEALRFSEIKIHRAWVLSKLTFAEQQSALGNRRIKKRANQRVRKLLSKHVPKCDPIADSLYHLNVGLKGLKNAPWMAAHWKQIDNLITVIEQEFCTGRSHPDAHQANSKETDPQADSGRESESLG